jgi:hypothetical protein
MQKSSQQVRAPETEISGNQARTQARNRNSQQVIMRARNRKPGNRSEHRLETEIALKQARRQASNRNSQESGQLTQARNRKPGNRSEHRLETEIASKQVRTQARIRYS